MLIFANEQLPPDAMKTLRRFGSTVPFSARGLVYDAVNGHPDLFFVRIREKLMVPPNLPQKYFQLLADRAINFKTGQNPVGFLYPASAKYNAVVTQKYFIHNLRISDPLILVQAEGLIKVQVNQGYTRCNLLALDDTHFITSDRGIYRSFHALNLQVIFVDPKGILLPGFSHGFFGGACGLWQQTVYISGSLSYHSQGEVIRQFIEASGFAIKELYDGPLFDGGSIVFVD